jgi:hypothetical protein
MTTFTEGRHAAEFIIWEPGGHYSRENGVVLAGENIAAGEVIMDNGAGKIVPYVMGTGNTVLGISIYPVNADGGVDVPAAYLAREAEVNGNLLTYEAESTAGGEEAAANAGLADLGIIVR